MRKVDPSGHAKHVDERVLEAISVEVCELHFEDIDDAELRTSRILVLAAVKHDRLLAVSAVEAVLAVRPVHRSNTRLVAPLCRAS